MKHLKIKAFLLILIAAVMLCSCELSYKGEKKANKVWFVGFAADYGKTGMPINLPEGKKTLPHLSNTIPDPVSLGKAFEELSDRAGIKYEAIYFVGDNKGGLSGDNVFGCTWNEYQDELINNLTPDKNDIVIFSYSGHGMGSSSRKVEYGDTDAYDEDGIAFYAESGKEGELVPYSELVFFLEEHFDCAKLLLVDVCYSGSMVVADGVSVDKNEYKSVAPISLLFKRDIRQSDSTWIITGGTFTQPVSDACHGHGAFTYYVLEALGWSDETNSIEKINALNGNVLSADSIARYVYKHLKKDGKYPQNVVFSAGSSDIILYKF